ncbi:MAG: hypothetical protein J7641_13080 [Cyanobacteria bacterium SID2]|nr:hypothetical protein [Cyanobacteria bacterium SID2]MBP0004943.1 hypothetical protein [Cyanobacteria bacterium SBC]
MKRKFWIFGGFILLGIAVWIAVAQLSLIDFKPDYLVNLSSILTLISFTVRSMLVLRILAICAQLTFIPYCFLQPTPLWTPIAWNLLFMGVNIFNLIVLLLEKRSIVFNPDEQKLYDLAFKTLSPGEFIKLMTIGEFRDGVAGEKPIAMGEPISYISILIDGKAAVTANGEKLLDLNEGKLIGLESVLAGEPAQFCEMTLDTPSRYIRWSVVQLQQFLNKRPDVREKFSHIVSQDLVKTIHKLAELELKKQQ